MADIFYPDFLSASTIKGDKIVNGEGEDLGKIEELMIDLQSGMIGYAILSFGGFMGLGDKLFAIPWQALSLRVHEHAFAINVSNETFDKAEGFDKDNWPLTREELSKTYSYYGYQPYWQTGKTAPAAGVSAATPVETESERMARMERKTREPTEVVEERVIPEEEIRARQEIERLEGLKGTQEEKISQLEKQRMEAQRKAEAERDRLAQLERERIEAERQAQSERERLLQLEKELQEARRKEVRRTISMSQATPGPTTLSRVFP